MFLFDLYITYLYQPFLNLLVGIYWLLSKIPGRQADMGFAVIIFTLALRFILLPISLASHRTEKERREIETKAKELKKIHSASPLTLKKETKSLFRGNPRIVIATTIDLTIQIAIALMLWRLFAKGLPGADLHLLYSFMPNVPQPYNLNFLGKYDLSHPHPVLNLIQSGVIFALETLRNITSPFPVTRGEVIRLQFFLPLVSYIIFSQLPAGKKLFVITTLTFSFFFTLIRWFYHLMYVHLIAPAQASKEPNPPNSNTNEPSSD